MALDEQILKIKELFEELLPRFGISHAKVYKAVMHGEIKTARQLGEETDISHHKVYSILKDLVEQNIVASINTNPANFHVKNPSKTFQGLINKKLGDLEKMTKEFEKVIDKEDINLYEREYIVKIKQKQTKLFDNKNKLLVKEARETRQLIERLTAYAAGLEPKKEYNYTLYRRA